MPRRMPPYTLSLSRPFSGPWSGLVTLGQELIENDELGRLAEEQCRAVVTRLASAMTVPRQEFLSEDYLVFAVHELEQPLSAVDVVKTRGGEIAAMLDKATVSVSARLNESCA